MIDWNRIAELRAEIGADDFQEVVDLFLAEADATVLRLTPDRDPKSLEADCHFLKGAALNLGFSALAAECQTREMQAALGQAVDDLSALRQIYHASRAALLAGQGA